MNVTFAAFIQPMIVEALLIEKRLLTGAAFHSIAAGMRSDPYETYRELRTRDPVHWSEVLQGYVLPRYADVDAVLRNQRFYSHTIGGQVPKSMANSRVMQRYFQSMSKAPPADHTRLRELVSKAFTPRSVSELRSQIRTIVDDLLTSIAPRGHMDVIPDFAVPLPVTVIAELLGIPAEDRTKFKSWSDEIARITEPVLTPELLQRVDRAEEELFAYLKPFIDERRERPREDLISGLVAAEEQGNKLSEEEVLSTIALLLIAGNETTTNLIGNGTLSLLRNPEQLERLRADSSLMEPAVEELLRFESPVHMSWRSATEDIEVGGRLVRRGQSVIPVLAAANRDPAAFPEPDTLDVCRRGERHLAFGFGNHYCLGSWLARLEGALAFDALLHRLPGLRLGGAPEWGEKVRLHGLKSLPVVFDAVTGAQS